MAAGPPTLVTVFSRWPSLLDEVFPHWPKQRIDLCLTWAIGADWETLRIDQVLLRLIRHGMRIHPDDDPKATLIAIREHFRDKQWVAAATGYREEDDPLVPWH